MYMRNYLLIELQDLHAKSSDPECLQEILQHRIWGFRAKVLNQEFQSWLV